MTHEEIVFYNGVDPSVYATHCEIQLLSIVFLVSLSAVIWFILNNRNTRGDK